MHTSFPASRSVRRLARKRAAWTSGLLACVSGCGAADEPTRDPLRLEQSVQMAAASGGEIVLEDGAALSVPAGALAADTEVTFSRETCGGVFA